MFRMSESLLNIIGCIVCPVAFIFSVYKIVRVFKINRKYAGLTTCKFTHVLRIRYLFITFCIRYEFEYVVDDVTYVNKALVFPIFGFSKSELENGVPVRYLKYDPDCVEFTNISRGVRVFGWLVIIGMCVAAGIVCFAEITGL